MTLYTLADLERARREAEAWDRRFYNDRSANPDKLLGARRQARRRVREIERALKEAGVLELTEREKLDARLDEAFPEARNRDVVTFEGRTYRRLYYPVERIRSRKTVTQWARAWVEVSEDQAS